MKRPYKEASPKQTLYKIQNILQEIDIFVTPVLIKNPIENIYSTRVEAVEEDGGFGTNGKGKSKLLSLASAYAELMERLQNLFIFGSYSVGKSLHDNIKDKTGFYYYPDEKLIHKDEFLTLNDKIFNDFFLTSDFNNIDNILTLIYDRLKLENRKGLISAPFYNLNERKVDYLPYNFLLSVTGSNGMAAGNTIAEATFQALCEIFERYAASEVYNKHLTPPTISDQFLEKFPNEFEIINKIRNLGYVVKVKDFSLNRNIPVLGLLILDTENDKYLLNIGSDTSFNIALSRTLTEIYQGLDLESFKNKLLEIPNSEITPYFYDTDTEECKIEKEKNFKNFVKNGTGIFPISLFGDDYSYEFNSKIFITRNSYEDEVKHLFSVAKSLDFNIYIRDVSFLGFPTVFLYIPNISPIGKKELNSSFDKNSLMPDNIEQLLFPFEKLINDKDRIEELLDIFRKADILDSKNDSLDVKEIFRINFKKNTIWGEMKINFFLVILFFINKDYKSSIIFLERYMKQYQIINDGYYNLVLKYFILLKDNKPTDIIPNYIIDDFKTPESIFSYIGFPRCPECNVCNLKNDCLTRINVQNTVNINNISKKTKINQYKFELFA